MKKREATALRRAFGKHDKGRGKRYDVALKRRALAYALERRAQGAKYEEIGAELGLALETVRRWCVNAMSSKTKPVAIVPVSVMEEAQSAPAIVSPSGFRLEGLDLRDAVLALKALG